MIVLPWITEREQPPATRLEPASIRGWPPDRRVPPQHLPLRKSILGFGANRGHVGFGPAVLHGPGGCHPDLHVLSAALHRPSSAFVGRDPACRTTTRPATLTRWLQGSILPGWQLVAVVPVPI